MTRTTRTTRTTMDYPYARGDLIDAPQRYSYSQYGGQAFVAAWRKDRATSLAGLPDAVAPLPAKPNVDPNSRQSIDLLERALGGDVDLREAFVKKFEIHKRVHDGYDLAFRALDKQARYTMSLYLRAADLFAAAYEGTPTLRYLNVYLKCLDTLCAEVARLSPDLAARLTWHLGQEAGYVDAVVQARGISA
ncbi:MAG: hypothetical protein HOK21_23160 [Rhodospirillaceae bacterium]|jgi:hypothetical protein|nr:hypothetical protein [Rhodospirillaceae bacterium]MBT4046574.1 hypothetical protein [Rhodospirillaceae bacterium]MBT4690864.1 hypothetical protein [Rhodospirillaceae bacterium]MBT5081555.1 hypothetical protein [Rhodospirillaceae bacterium]MBT5526997.1 hypothetical protein [Rhodospirillaceae bacterium]